MSARRTEPTTHLFKGGAYIPADKTDIRKTFARLTPKPAANVSSLITKRKAAK